MKIAVIGSKGLPPRQGGIEHHCAELYSRLAAMGNQVEVFARSSYSEQTGSSRYLYRGVRVNNLPSIPMRGIDAFANSGLAALIASLRNFDVIHFHALGPAIFSWVPRLLAPKTKVVVTCHGLDWQRAKWGKFSTRLLKMGEQAAVHFAHEIGVVSEDLKHYFLHKYNRPTTYIGNAPAPYPDSDPSFSFVESHNLKKGHYILFLGRLVPEKRPDLLISAFQRLLPEDWKLVLVGGNSDTTKYVQQLKLLAGSNPNICFAGELKGERLAETVRGAGIFVLPSQLEGLPLALLEAMAEGIPVIASDIPIHREIVGLDRGLLFEEGNIDHCTSALGWAINNIDKMQSRASTAQKHINKYYNWDKIAQDWLFVYEKLHGVAALNKTPISL